MSEIELKFILDEPTSSELWTRVKALKLANGSPKTKTLRSIYLDTPEHALKRLCLDAIPDASVREEVLRRVNGAPLQPVCARPRPVT